MIFKRRYTGSLKAIRFFRERIQQVTGTFWRQCSWSHNRIGNLAGWIRDFHSSPWFFMNFSVTGNISIQIFSVWCISTWWRERFIKKTIQTTTKAMGYIAISVQVFWNLSNSGMRRSLLQRTAIFIIIWQQRISCFWSIGTWRLVTSVLCTSKRQQLNTK